MEHEHPSITFLKSLYKHCDQGFINLRFLPSAKNFFVPLTEVKAIPSILTTHQDQDAYFGVATRQNGDGTKQGIIQIPALWVDYDLDLSAEAHGEKELHSIFFNFPLEPTFIILTGGGFHGYWRLKEPVDREEILKVEDLLKRLASYLGGDTAATDASRVLRVPGSLNYKYDPGRDVSLWHLTENEYDLSNFDFLPEIEIKTEKERSTQNKGWEKELLNGVLHGERNTAIARLAGRYLNKGLLRDEILPILFDVNSRNKPPLGEKEVETTLDSIIKTHQRSLPERVEYKKEEKGQRINYRLTTLDEVLEYPEPTFLIDPVLIEGTVSVLGAYTGTGKSIAALSIIKSLLTGKPFGENTR